MWTEQIEQTFKNAKVCANDEISVVVDRAKAGEKAMFDEHLYKIITHVYAANCRINWGQEYEPRLLNCLKRKN